MSRVSFADGSTPASDSPRKGYRINSGHTITKFDLYEHRDELRYNMHRKTTVIENEKFMGKFFATCPSRTKYVRDLFLKIKTPSNETEMYDTLVSPLGTLYARSTAAHPLLLTSPRC